MKKPQSARRLARMLLTAGVCGIVLWNLSALGARDPFWPVGYEPPREVRPTPVPTPPPTEPAEADTEVRVADVSPDEERRILASIRMEGFLRTGTSLFAIMNQQVVAVGEKLRLRIHGQVREFLIVDLTEETIRLRPL